MLSRILSSSLLPLVLSSLFASSPSISRAEDQMIDQTGSTKSGTTQSLEHKPQGNKSGQKPKKGEGVLLEGEDLHDKMLAGARLKKAKLKGANLSNAMLAGADLRQADLEQADLHGAMLLGANLSGANLANANFEGAMLLGAQLEGARIDGANFANTFLDQEQVDEACGMPKALPKGLRLPKRC